MCYIDDNSFALMRENMTHFSLKSNGSKTVENFFTGIAIPTLKNEDRLEYRLHFTQIKNLKDFFFFKLTPNL